MGQWDRLQLRALAEAQVITEGRFWGEEGDWRQLGHTGAVLLPQPETPVLGPATAGTGCTPPTPQPPSTAAPKSLICQAPAHAHRSLPITLHSLPAACSLLLQEEFVPKDSGGLRGQEPPLLRPRPHAEAPRAAGLPAQSVPLDPSYTRFLLRPKPAPVGWYYDHTNDGNGNAENTSEYTN